MFILSSYDALFSKLGHIPHCSFNYRHCLILSFPEGPLAVRVNTATSIVCTCQAVTSLASQIPVLWTGQALPARAKTAKPCQGSKHRPVRHSVTMRDDYAFIRPGTPAAWCPEVTWASIRTCSEVKCVCRTCPWRHILRHILDYQRFIFVVIMNAHGHSLYPLTPYSTCSDTYDSVSL